MLDRGEEMNTIDAIHARHSYRGEYRPDKVLREDLTSIMN